MYTTFFRQQSPLLLLLILLIQIIPYSFCTSAEVSCERELKVPLPSGKICGARGTLKNAQLIANVKMPIRPGDPSFFFYFDYCANQCQELPKEPCGSFAVDQDAGTCKLFKQSLSQGFKKKPATSGPKFYDNVCLKYNCETFAVTDLTPSTLTTYDDESWLVTTPFPVLFNSVNYTKIWVSMNGFVSFGEDQVPGLSFTNEPLPSSNLPSRSLAVFWDDLIHYARNDTQGRGDLPYSQTVSYRYSPSQVRFTWKVQNRVSDGAFVDATLSMYPNSAIGRINYDNIDQTEGSSATVGIQDGNYFSEYTSNGSQPIYRFLNLIVGIGHGFYIS